MFRLTGWLLALGVAVQGAALAAEDVASKLEKASSLLSKGRFADALELYTLADRESGGASADALLGMGLARLMLDQAQDAEVASRRALELELTPQQTVDAWALLGNAIYKRERAAWRQKWMDAEASERTADGESEPKAPARRFLHWDTGDLPAAEAAFRKVLELTAGKANTTRLSLVEVVRRLGRFDEALTILEQYKQFEKAAGRQPRTDDVESCLRWAGGDDRGRSTDETDGTLGEVIKPRRLNQIQPVYTDEARRAGIEGQVILETIVTEQGKVECIDVMQDQPMGLSAAAIQAVRQFRFKPATLEGKPVAVWYTVTINFHLRSGIGGRP